MFNKILFFLILFSLYLPCSIFAEQLTPAEIDRLKEGKTFWKWETSKGPYFIRYIEQGSGNQHVILLHGFGANVYSWKFLIDPLAKAGYHVWAIDLLGFGLSDKPLQATYGLDLFLQLIDDFMKDHKIDRANLVGNSMGGGIALGMAIYHSKRVSSLTLIDALAYPISLPFTFTLLKFIGPTFAKPLVGKGLTRRILKKIMYDPNKITEEQVEAYTIPYYMPGGLEASVSLLRNFDDKLLIELQKRYGEIKVPILIIWGNKDRWIPLSHFERLQQEFPQAKTQLIPNCGHIPQEECPDAVSNDLIPFLNTVGF